MTFSLKSSLASMASIMGGPSDRAKHAPIPLVRVGFIGLGGRSRSNLGHFLSVEGVKVVGLADPGADSIQAALEKFKEKGIPLPDVYPEGPEDYRRLLARDDLDLVVIGTRWEDHARHAVAAMVAGKHAAIEVPAAVTLKECWDLVKTAEKTGRHCMMLENCCYGREELLCLNLCRLGILGELLHGEAAYIHELRGQMKNTDSPLLMGIWRTMHYVKRNGNLYPTHGVGPIAQYMGINRGDRFTRLASMSSPARGRALYAKANFPPDHRWNQVKRWHCGDMNTSILQTELGRTVLVQWDETTPRPYSRLNLIQGTRGTWAGYPDRLVIEGETPDTHHWMEGEALKPFMEKYEHPLFKRVGELAVKHGGHGGMDFLMVFRLIECLRNGEPLDQDVYDAAAWSAIGPLSEKSIQKRGSAVPFPDFTRGKWKTMAPLGIVP